MTPAVKNDNRNGKKSLTLFAASVSIPVRWTTTCPLGSCGTSGASLTGLDMAGSALPKQIMPGALRTACCACGCAESACLLLSSFSFPCWIICLGRWLQIQMPLIILQLLGWVLGLFQTLTCLKIQQTCINNKVDKEVCFWELSGSVGFSIENKLPAFWHSAGSSSRVTICHWGSL